MLRCFATLNGVPVGDGRPIRAILSARIVMSELNQFSAHEIVCAASEEAVILALAPFTLLQIIQDGLLTTSATDDGTIAYGYVLNPREQITDRDEHTITLSLEPLTDECTRHRLHRGWQAQNKLSVIASRLGSFTANWSGVYLPTHGSGPGFTADGTDDISVLFTTSDTTPVGGFLAFAKQFSSYARQGVDANGAPTRVLEMGQFGAAATVTLTSANGGGADEMAANGTILLPATIDRAPADVTNLMTVCTPFGGGASTDTNVTLERLWRLINDPNYPGYGRYGSDAESIARLGQTSLFPEYDPAYPISDPENPPTGVTVFDNSPQANLIQGAIGTRFPTLDGHWDYMMYDTAAYATSGHFDREFVQPGITYTDSSPANQELSARALYVAAIANFKHFSHPHHSFACTAPGLRRPTRAGNLIAVDYQRVSVQDDGAVVETNAVDTLRVMRVVRVFQGESVPMDEYTLSNLGRFDQDDPAGTASAAKAILSLQINRGTGLAKDSVTVAGNIDAANPITLWHYIAAEHFRYHQVRVRVDFFPFRGTATTAENPTGTHIVTVGDIDIDLPTPDDINLNGTFTADGTGAPGTTDGFDYIKTGIDNTAAVKMHVAPFVQGRFATADMLAMTEGGGKWGLGADAGSLIGDGIDVPATINFTKNDTKSAFTAPIHKLVKAARSIIAHIPAGTALADLPLHTHDVEKRIPTGQPSPHAITMSINGIALSSGAKTSGTRNADGSFASSFIVDDIGVTLDAFPPGTDVPLRFDAGTDPTSNPFGVGWLQITLTATEELGGEASTVIAS